MALTFGGRLLNIFLKCRYMIVNQLKQISPSPAFEVSQKIHSMLVKSKCDNKYVRTFVGQLPNGDSLV